MNPNPRTEAEWDEWKADREAGLVAVSAFLNRYGRGCKRCETTEAKFYLAYTPKTFNCVTTIKHPVWEMVISGREDFARAYLDAVGAEVFCARCIRQTPSNGRWTAILEARRLEEEKLAKEKNSDG